MSAQYYIPTITEQLNALHKIITQMQTDLDSYQATNGQNKYSYFKQQQVKILLGIYGNLQDMADALLKEKAFKAENTIFKLEGICLLHGISDIKYWYTLPTMHIANTVKEAYAEGWRQTPFELMPGNKIDLIHKPSFADKPKLDWSKIEKPKK